MQQETIKQSLWRSGFTFLIFCFNFNIEISPDFNHWLSDTGWLSLDDPKILILAMHGPQKGFSLWHDADKN